MVDLLSFDQLKTMLNLEGNSIDDYPQIRIMQDCAAAAIENFLGRKIACGCGIYRERFDLPFALTRMVFLNVLPVHCVNKLVHVEEEEEEEIDKYSITPYGVALKQPKGGGYLIVDYLGGSNTISEDISNAAALLQTISNVKRKDFMGTPVSIDHPLGVSTTIPEIELTSEVKRLLHRHQHPKFNNSFNESMEIV